MSVKAEVERGAESWQFFAFVFAAVVTLLFGLIDEIPNHLGWLIVLEIASFGVVGHTTLLSARRRNWLVWVLGRFKKERLL